MLAVTAAAGCSGEGQRPFSPGCPTGQIKAQIGDAIACYVYCGDRACPDGLACIDTVCLPSASSQNNTGGGGSTNNGAADAGTATDDSTNGEDPNCTVETEDLDCATAELCDNGRCRAPRADELDECQQYCDLIWGSCLRETCTGLDADGLAGLEQECIYGGVVRDDSGAETSRFDGCLRDILSPAVRQQNLRFIAEETCDSLSYFRCGRLGLVEACACEEPLLGTTCTGDDDCDGGDLAGACIPEIDENDQPTGFPGGYCIAGPCQPRSSLQPGQAYAAPTCGDFGACLVTSDTSAICIDRCFSQLDCREGYLCNALNFTTTTDPETMKTRLGVISSCDRGCTTAADCAEGFVCNGRICEFSCEEAKLESLCTAYQGVCLSREDGIYCVLP